MITTLITFLGGSAFRLIFGAAMDWFKSSQDHKQELAMQAQQEGIESAKRAHELDRLRLQKELDVKEIQVIAESAEIKAMADSFLEAVKATTQKTGVAFIDAWNGSIRPAGASMALLLWGWTIITRNFVLTDFDTTLISAFLGIFVGDRIHSRMKS